MGSLTEREALHRSRAACLEHIRNLNCWGSDLCEINIIRKMVNIEVLNLSANNIVTLEDIAYCPKLRELYLRRNQIQSLEELKYLKNLPQLSVLWLADNPCASNEKYRETVLQNLPNLRKLDSKEVLSEEKNVALRESVNLYKDETVPDYTGLDLNHTLTLKQVTETTYQNSPHNKIYKEANTEEKLPVSSSIDIDTVNKKRLELGLKQLDLGISSSINTSSNGYRSAFVANVEPRNSLSASTSNTSLQERSSNTVEAIKLLMIDLSVDELQHIVNHTQRLIVQIKREPNGQESSRHREMSLN